jgi:hypothetical protein
MLKDRAVDLNGVSFRVVFCAAHFVFDAVAAFRNNYIHAIRRAPPLHHAKDAPCEDRQRFAWSLDMKLVARIFGGRRVSNLVTELERQRLGKTMPGQTAALAASRYGFLLN